jgi:uncharacterized protein YoxC
MTPDQLNLVFGVAAVVALAVIALAALIGAVALRRTARDVRAVATSANELLGVLNQEVPAALRDLRTTSAELAKVAAQVPPRLERVDGLLDEADASVQSLRATIEAAEEMVRGPAAALDRAKRGVHAAGAGLARGADRLRRRMEDRSAKG